MTDKEREFYAGFKSTMTDDDHRRNRNSSIRMAHDEIVGVLGALGQARQIRAPTEGDLAARADLEFVAAHLKDLLAATRA